jgi:hypothetical protein
MIRILTSSKGQVSALGIIGTAVLAGLGVVPGGAALQTIALIVGAYVGGTAVEDAVGKLRGPKK